MNRVRHLLAKLPKKTRCENQDLQAEQCFLRHFSSSSSSGNVIKGRQSAAHHSQLPVDRRSICSSSGPSLQITPKNFVRLLSSSSNKNPVLIHPWSSAAAAISEAEDLRVPAVRKLHKEAYQPNMDQPKLLTAEEYKEFRSVYDELVQDIVADPEFVGIPGTMKAVKKLFDYTVPHGKQNRGLLCSSAYRYLTNDLSDNSVHLSYVLSWCIEILQAYFLVVDDIMDESETRRGQPCWHKVEGVAALNDGMILENSLYAILKKHFSTKPYYVKLMEIFHDVTLKTTFGQSLDTRTSLEKNISQYNYDLYSSIIKYKTSYYSFYLPVSLAMTMVGISDIKLFQQAEAITLELGHLFQVQDDYLDVFGDPQVTGKIGTDIQDGKCSWLVVVALQNASPEVKQFILENYGINDPEKVAAIKAIYKDLGIIELYRSYEDQHYDLICSHIKELSERLPQKLFEDMLNKIYKRKS